MIEINAKTFYSMLMYAAKKLASQAERINSLNVFPVPDGDTGSNMSMTLNGVASLTEDELSSLGNASKAAAGLMLRSARGNSGVILSVYFKGFAASLEGYEAADTTALTHAFGTAADAAYASVMNPAEGTILSVMRAVAEKSATLSLSDINEYFSELVNAAEAAIAATPDQLPVLREAGVVDAGGCGFTVILSSMNDILNGNADTSGFIVPKPKSSIAVNAAAESDAEIVFPYCTECIIEKASSDSSEPLHSFIMSKGDSAVFVDDGSIIKLHVHTADPGEILTEALNYGALASVKIENMKKQHTELANAAIPSGVGFVAVANGDGLREIFLDLGVNEVVFGGQTMNPSTDELLDAVRRVGLSTVFLMPNNKNIILAANAAAEAAAEVGIRVLVIPTRSVPQGITALYSYQPEVTAEENLEEMSKAAQKVKTLSVTKAVRDAVIDGLDIKKEQYLGLSEGKAVHSDNSLQDCVMSLVPRLSECDCITVYYGNDINSEKEAELSELLSAAVNSQADLSFVRGEQPVYSLLISGE